MDTQAGPAQTARRDAELRHARRVDWRFLLGHPSLGDVVLAGAPTPELQAALAAHAASTRDLDGEVADPAASSGVVDGALADVVVVAGSIPASTLARCAAALRPDGWLVAEVAGLAAWRPGRPVRGVVGSADRLVRRLAAMGFEPASVYVAWPDHAATTAFVPVRDRAAMSAWVARRVHARMAAIGSRMAALAAGASVTTTLTPAITVIARRRAPGTPPGPAASSWMAARASEALAGDDPSIILLTPRFRASAHVVGLAALDASPAGGPRAVLKAARLDRDVDNLAREAAAIQAVAPTLGATGLAPRLLAFDAGSAPPFIVESGLAGRPLDPSAVRRDPASAARGIAALVARMPDGDRGPIALGEVVGPALQVLREQSSQAALTDLVARTDALMGPVLGVQVPTVFEHGDLAHPNLIGTPGGAIGAVDWERAAPHGLPLHDLAIGLAYVAAAARRARTPEEQAAAFQDALSGEDPWLRDLVDTEAARLGVDPAIRPALLVAPWLRTAAWLAERTEPAWWPADRSVALWRAMLGRPPEA